MVGRAAFVRVSPHGGACCGGVWRPLWWSCVASCCFVLRCVAVCCVVLCWVLLCVVVACGPPHCGASCVGVRCVLLCFLAPVWWGVLRWCVPPPMVGRVMVVCGPPHGGAVFRCVVLRRVALRCVVLCCVALCCVCWWCVAPRMVGRAAFVCDPPLGGACCVGERCVEFCGVLCCGGVWPPVWWGVLRWCVAISWWSLLWWCVPPLMVGRALLACVGRLFLVVVSLLLGGDGRAGLPSACGAPALYPGRDGQAGLPSACGAPPRVVVSRVLSPCGSFSFVRILVCARFLPGRWRRPLLPPPPPGFCLAGVVIAPLFFLSLHACLFMLWAACRRLLPPVVPNPPVWFGFCCCLPPVACFRVLALCVALALPRRFRLPAPSHGPRGLCCAGVAAPLLVFPCVPAACLLLRPVCFVSVRRRWLLPRLPAPHPPGCVPRVVLPCPLCSLCLLFSARPSAVCLCLVLPSPHFCLCPLLGRHRPCSACLFARSGVRCTLPCCAVCCCPSCVVWCRLVLRWVAVCCVVPRGAVWCGGVLRGAVYVAVPCCFALWCAFGPGVLLRSVLLALRLAVLSWPFFLCAVLCCVSWCCAALRCVLLFRVLLCCCALCCLLGGMLLFIAFLAAAPCCAVPSGAVCFAACCAVLCWAAVCCAASGGVLSWCAVLCCSRCVLLLRLGLLLCVLCCASWRCPGPLCVLLFLAVQCCCALCCVRGAVLLFPALLGAALCCALPSGVVRCCQVPCRLVRCLVVLRCAVRAVLYVLLLFCGVCCFLWLSVVLPAPGALFPPCIFKNRKIDSRAFSKTEKLSSAGVLPFVPCPPCMQQYHTLKQPACFIYLTLRLGLVWFS